MQEFLDAMAAKLSMRPGSLHLYREWDGALHLITPDKNFVYIKPDFGHSTRLHKYYIKMGDTTITEFGMYEFPSCCAFCVSTGVWVSIGYRNRGVNTIANKLRQWIAKEMGYSALVCTDAVQNTFERKTLDTNGFQHVFTCKNKRTANDVSISVKLLE